MIATAALWTARAAAGEPDCHFHTEVPDTCDGSLAYDNGPTAMGTGPEYCALDEDLVHWCSTHFLCGEFAARCPDFEEFIVNSLAFGDNSYHFWHAGRCTTTDGRVFDLISWQYSVDYPTNEYAFFDPSSGRFLGYGGSDTGMSVRCCGENEDTDESWVGEYIPFYSVSTCEGYDNAYWRDKLGLWPEAEHTADTAAPATDDRGCRCSSAGGAPWLVAPLLALALRRRRRC
ncbi:MAG: hypothetical protein ABMA64_42140 [Myxococcota bacterium]